MSAVLIASGESSVTALYSGDSVYQGSQGIARIALNTPPGAALVVPVVASNPVYEVMADANWPYILNLVEKGGVATTITGFTINGVSNLGVLGPNPRLAANGTIAVSLVGSGIAPPLNRIFVFSGTDANGNKWTQQLTVPFLAPLGTQIAPGILLTSPATTVQQNPQADPSCQWSLPVAVQELGGYPTLLTAFSAGGSSLSSQIQTVFGTTRLAPYGVLRGTVCFTGSTPPTAKSVQISGPSSLGPTVSSTLAVSFSGPSAAPAAMSVGLKSLSLASPQGSTSGSVPLNFTGGSPQWTASVTPANRTSNWLTVTPSVATGSSPVQIQASAANLSPWRVQRRREHSGAGHPAPGD